jgi:hypothetical protein
MVASALVASFIAWVVGQMMPRDKCHSHGLHSMSAMTNERANSQSWMGVVCLGCQSKSTDAASLSSFWWIVVKST